MNTRTIVSLTLLASMLGIAGCAQAPRPAATAADYPMLGFASPGAGQNDPSESPRFEEDRILLKPVVMTDKWAR
ncbi:MAG TPA: hypothetical protein VGL81_11755 [Polyangiaceae bacterium]